MPAKKKTPLVSYDALSDEVKAIMDRAVRIARQNYWCDRFDGAAQEIFNVARADVVDSDGFSCEGYDREGYDAKGFNRDGYNREGYNEKGFNKAGFDREGYDRHGNDKNGVDRQGRDRYRYDFDGYDQEGYHSMGLRRRATRQWFEAQAAKPATNFEYDAQGGKRPKATARKTAVKKAAPKKTVAPADAPPTPRRRVRLP